MARASSNNDLAAKYEKMSPREHVLRRPDTYIGSVGVVEEEHFVLDKDAIHPRTISYTPGLAKIFDECLVNALDHVVRVQETGGEKVTEVSVDIDDDTGAISVCNNGEGIDVEVHPQHGVYIPQLIFGELLTSTNYDDAGMEKLWGGRNGYGAKLANIWSKKFVVETYDKSRGRLYQQTFEENMSVTSKPKVTSRKTGKSFTRVTFWPDYPRMGLPKGLSTDMASLLRRRVYDAAAVTPSTVAVRLNGKVLPVKTFKDYIKMFGVEGAVASLATKNARWEVGIVASSNGFSQVSFVNGIHTRKGGSHVNYVVNAIAKQAMAMTKKAESPLKASYIKDNLQIFLRCVVPNPTFSSQTKEELTSPSSAFSASFDVKPADLAKIIKSSGILERAEALMQFHENRKVKAAAGKKQTRLFIPKLDDANNAGTKKSHLCTLILTEGDSAKTMAISGLAVVGRDNYGVFPLRGKLLNITDKSIATALKNEEVANIVKILGLKPNQSNTVEELRYGRVMIMADQDHDGIHIRGLVMNLFRVFFPDLFKIDGFIVSMLTPVIKARTSKEVLSFYSVDDFRSWQAKQPDTKAAVKYFKGLGSSTTAEAREYFKDMQVVQYKFSDKSDERMSLAFSKTRADDRKEWLMAQDKDADLADYTLRSMDYAHFVNTELVQFSMRDVARSIPHLMDGLKESTRKILYGSLKRTPKGSEVKVAQLAGYIAQETLYHHGEESLNKAITAMAQSFPGSNNLPLLEANGQFGSRLSGGEDRASPRYIHTRAADITSKVFRPEDDVILDHKYEEGVRVEPTTYYPVIPMILVNGAIGIGTGFSVNVPMYNPTDLVAAIKQILNGKSVPPLTPWYNKWTGVVQAEAKAGSFTSFGRVTRDKKAARIVELPVYKWTEDYKCFLENLVTGGTIKSFKSQYTDTDVLFEVELLPNTPDNPTALVELLQLRSNRNLSTNNIHLFSMDNTITKFASAEEVLETWAEARLEAYGRRKVANLEALRHDMLIASEKARFITSVIAEEIKVMNVKSDAVVSRLKALKFHQDPSSKFDYLLKMPIQQLTLEKKERLLAEASELSDKVATLEESTPQSLWLSDLDEFVKAWDGWLREHATMPQH